jgi:hypothetical protein
MKPDNPGCRRDAWRAAALHGVEGFGLGSFLGSEAEQTTTRPPVVPIAKLKLFN